MSCGVVGVPFPARPLCGTVGTGIDGRTTRVGSRSIVHRPATRFGRHDIRALSPSPFRSECAPGWERRNGWQGELTSAWATRLIPAPRNRPATHTLPPSRPPCPLRFHGEGSGRGPGSRACLPARRPRKLLPTPASRTGPSIESGGDRSGVGSALLGAVGGSDGTFSVTAPRL